MDDPDGISRRALLSSEEETALTCAVRKGDEAAKAHLVEGNQRLVLNIARTFRTQMVRKEVPFEPLFGWGQEGLIHAIDGFDSAKGFRFSTFAAHWIRRSIAQSLKN